MGILLFILIHLACSKLQDINMRTFQKINICVIMKKCIKGDYYVPG